MFQVREDSPLGGGGGASELNVSVLYNDSPGLQCSNNGSGTGPVNLKVTGSIPGQVS